ncbi:UDP-Glycosyltransferase/glycogen phosphorylase [Rhizodiscina lignyota]|uniref:UDP-Glycosyltransferase/glycogen phosphorylase n=1 Tax=Rhizodiscina lignyota TaxID=1504668 RepID=A0A9P4IRS4_9PEZI|nr:UDP-Glycosyltransferase/glycogen phosphorylase [Rhizodiscina lignyota]
MPAWSHVEKVATLAEGLVKLGYPVTFMSNEAFKDQVERTGAKYVQLEGHQTELMAPEDMAKMMEIEDEEERETFAINVIFAKALAGWRRTFQRTLRDLNDIRTIYLHDSSFLAGGPSYLGAPGFRPHVDMAIGIHPILRASNYTYPFRSGKNPDTGPDAFEKHWAAQQEQDKEYMFRTLKYEVGKVYQQLGAIASPGRWGDLISDFNDIWLAMAIPEFEYDRPDWDHRVEFIGMTTTVGVENQSLPVWWDDVLEAKKSGKTIIAASASSMDFDPTSLVLPTIEAFRNRDDVFVVAALVNFDPSTLNFEIPSNARVAKFIPMNEFLPHVDVLVSSAGYGTVQHALRNGVPMVLAGEAQDKQHTGPIAEWSGIGIYIGKTAVPPNEIQEAVDKIILTPSYKETGAKLATSYKKYEPIERIDGLIKESLAKLEAM